MYTVKKIKKLIKTPILYFIDFVKKRPVLHKKFSIFCEDKERIVVRERVVLKNELLLKRYEEQIESMKNQTEIILYFFGGMGQTYQLNQWVDTFLELNKKHRITVLARDKAVVEHFRKILPFYIHYAYTINDVLSFYEEYKPKVIIYINNGFKNFQSLIYNDAMHIHINHGESDKASDHSNQIKGYDFVFVHGQNGFDNYMKYLIKINPKKFILTGRPQLDFIRPIKLDTHGKKVIIYAPTWEATHRSMRYTSVDVYGEKIVDTILNNDNYYLIYKPHPNLGANDKKLLEIHKRLLKKISEHPDSITITNEDINNIYPIVDFAIFDMSSVMTDYLHVDKPFVLADVFNLLVHNVEEYNVLKGCNRITKDIIEEYDGLEDLIFREIYKDPKKIDRQFVRKLYLGDYKEGESIKKFIDSISDIIDFREKEIREKERRII